MKSYLKWWLLMALLGAVLPGSGADTNAISTNGTSTNASSTNTPAANKPKPGWPDRQGCTKNLREIYVAIQAYQADHKDLPNWLSDLVPEYLPDVNVLICPLCRRTGKSEAPPLADPKLPSSYLYEFCPVPLGSLTTNAPKRTYRDWKRRQMGLLGSAVPIVRCRHHTPALNLAFDGKVYESPAQWEWAFTNRINAESLSAAKLFEDVAPPFVRRFQQRNPDAGPGLLDLTKFYNVAFSESWMGKTNETLSVIPKGLQKFQGIVFDVRGLIQLAGKASPEKKFPSQAKGLPAGLKCKRLHFLHAAMLGTVADEGKQIGSYFVHYAGNPARLEVPIVYGQDLENLRPGPEEKGLEKVLKPAWNATLNGATGSSGSSGRRPRLFISSWTNLAPDAEIETIDFVSSLAGAAPLLVAISAE